PVVERLLVLVQVLDKRNDAARVVKFVLLLIALIFDCDEQTPVEKRQLAQPLRKNIKTELSRLENFVVRFETDFRSAPIRVACHLERAGWDTALVALYVNFSASPDLEVQPFGQSIDDGDTNAVQSARNLVSGVIEFAAGVKLRKNNFGR